MKRYIVTVLLLAFCFCMSGRDDRYLGEMKLYPESGFPSLTAAPQGYDLFYISHYGRHGSRALTSERAPEAEYAWGTFSTAHYKRALTPEGERLFEELDKVYKANENHYGFLTQKGVSQHAAIASRMAANFPEIIRPGARINVMVSVYPRCIMSMASFTNTLQKCCGGLEFSYACSPGIQGYINAHTPKFIKNENTKPEYYEGIAKDFDEDTILLKYFKNKKAIKKYVSDKENLLYYLNKLAVNSPNLDVETKLLDMVPEEIVKYYGARRNREIYYRACNSGDFGALKMATTDSLVLAIVQKADAAVAGSGPDVDLCFGHDFALAPICSHLGVECTVSGLKGTDIDKAFNGSELVPMAANLQQLFYRNAEGDVLVKFLLNEREVKLMGLQAVDGIYYRWQDVRSMLMSQITPRREIYVEGGRFHVQGLAYDAREDCMYMSFTSAFYKVDMQGKVLAGISGINGHLGAMVFDPASRKVYASLELKDDVIGRNISKGLADKEYSREESVFYVAQIDVDKLTSMDMPEEGILKRIRVDEACADYKAVVTMDGKALDHRFACSGIDGMAIAPAPGAVKSARRYLYVAYGVYGDVSRKDNDYNVLLAYPLDYVQRCASSAEPALKKYTAKYFVHTGNTRWGVQNMTYDPVSKQLFLAVYKGEKPQWHNYSLFAVDMTAKSFKAALDGVPYLKSATQLSVAASSDFKWGATGMCALGDGRFYISENGKKAGCNYCTARIYTLDEIIK